MIKGLYQYFPTCCEDDQSLFEIYLDIIFHDFYYVPGSSFSNEYRSFQSAVDYNNILNKDQYLKSLRLTYNPFLSGIKLTRNHSGAITKRQQILLDLDLLILAAPKHEYLAYLLNIRDEYFTYSQEEFDNGRIKFLKKYLSKRKIFVTKEMEHLNPIARENMKKELETLRVVYDKDINI